MNDKKFFSKNYQLIKTADGSPTLIPFAGLSDSFISMESTRSCHNKEEPMHSLQGALSESLSIYGTCLSKVMKLRKSRILSFGLGLGYNELIANGILLKESKSQFLLVSFEKDKKLIESFKSWLKEKKIELYKCYDEILKSVSGFFGQNPEELKKFCYRNFEEGQFQIQGELPQKNPFPFGFTGILYDPFSSKSNPKLWSTDFLENFIESYCDPEECIFSTYASTGNLKRVLKHKGFYLFKRKGFSKKRESTLAFLE